VVVLLIVLAPTSLSGGILNTLLSSTLTKAVAPQEIGGILGISTSVESSTRILAQLSAVRCCNNWAHGHPVCLRHRHARVIGLCLEQDSTTTHCHQHAKQSRL